MNVNTPNEIVKDLCERAEDANRRGYSGEASELIEISSLIESLTTENKRLTDHAENLRLDYVDLLAEKESITTQLAESQRKEKAAVEMLEQQKIDYICSVRHYDKYGSRYTFALPSQWYDLKFSSFDDYQEFQMQLVFLLGEAKKKWETRKQSEWRGVAEGEQA